MPRSVLDNFLGSFQQHTLPVPVRNGRGPAGPQAASVSALSRSFRRHGHSFKDDPIASEQRDQARGAWTAPLRRCTHQAPSQRHHPCRFSRVRLLKVVCMHPRRDVRLHCMHVDAAAVRRRPGPLRRPCPHLTRPAASLARPGCRSGTTDSVSSGTRNGAGAESSQEAVAAAGVETAGQATAADTAAGPASHPLPPEDPFNTQVRA